MHNHNILTHSIISRPYLLFLGDVTNEPLAKTAFGIRDWARDETIGQLRLPTCAVDLGLPDLTAAQAAERGARAMLIGVAPIGGKIPDHWTPALLAALEAGLDLVSGMHTRLRDLEQVSAAAARLGRKLFDVRHADREFPVASGEKRSGRRLLTVGTDCALGKKYAALAIARALQKAGFDADFRATGQTGIMIAGDGIALDAIPGDFIAGAAETLSPAAPDRHWDVIEGQGSLFHPAYAGVTLGLIHGSQPDAMVLCHDPQRTHLHSHPGYPLVDLQVAIDRYVDAARLTNASARVEGISLNTSRMREQQADALMSELRARFGIPCFDPMRSDLTPLVRRLTD